MEQLEHATGQNLIAAAREAAYEGYQGHGVLTYTILEAFEKLGTTVADDKVDVNSLARHVAREFPKLLRAFTASGRNQSKSSPGATFRSACGAWHRRSGANAPSVKSSSSFAMSGCGRSQKMRQTATACSISAIRWAQSSQARGH